MERSVATRANMASARRRFLGRWVWAVVAAAAAGLADFEGRGDELEVIRQRGSLRWGGDQEGGGPFVYPAADDPRRLIGFEVEIAELIAGEIGVRSEFCQGQWDKLPSQLDRGDIDLVLNGYEWSPQRAERYGVSIPYYLYELQLLGRADDNSLGDWSDVRHRPGQARRRVSVLGGSAAHDYLIEHYARDVEIVQFEGATDAMRTVELAVDGLDANLQDLPVWSFYGGSFPRLRAVGEPVGRGFYVVLVRKSETALLAAVNRAIARGLENGELRRICTRYGIWNATQAFRGLEVDASGSFIGPTAALSGEEGAGEPEAYQAVRGWAVVAQRGWLLVQAAGMTAVLSFASMPLAMLLGLAAAVGRRYGPRPVRFASGLYVELIRGTPLVLQLYVIFFLLPEIGLSIQAFWAAVLGLAINYSAYEAEIYRAGLQAVPRGQLEAATALGMSRWLTLRRVVIPQAVRIVIPPVTNDFIALFKDTAVCSVITVVELSKQYYIHARSTGAILELGLLTAVLYLAMSYPLSLLSLHLERHLARERTR